MMTDEWSTCRQTQATAITKVHEILSSGLTRTKFDSKLEDWEFLSQFGEAHKQPSAYKSARASVTLSSLNTTAATLKPTKKFVKRTVVEVDDFKPPQ